MRIESVSLSLTRSGVPVIGSDVHGINELVADGESGLLFEPGKADDLVEALVRLLKDETLALRIRHTAARMIRERFNARLMAREHMDVYQKVARR